jgi:large subunit ribosomal protein L25
MEKIELKAQKRKELGRKVNKLRREGIIPANIYGSGFKSESIQVNSKDFAAVYKKAGETSVVEITLDGEKKTLPVLIHNIQIDPVSDLPIHIDFLKIDLTKKVTADVPLELQVKLLQKNKDLVLWYNILMRLRSRHFPVIFLKRFLLTYQILLKLTRV